jgi:hypothetical protein
MLDLQRNYEHVKQDIHIDPRIPGFSASVCSLSSLSRSRHLTHALHPHSQSCEMDEILSIANRHCLFVAEDLVRAFSWWKLATRELGSIGTVGTFGFFSSKNPGGFSNAGMVSTNDREIGSLIRMFLKHIGRTEHNVDHSGRNARLDTLQAAILVAKPVLAEVASPGMLSLSIESLQTREKTLPVADSRVLE